MTLSRDLKIDALIETRINGNSIKGNETYEKMLRSLKFSDIRSYASLMDYKTSINDIGKSQKLDLINSIVKRNF